MPRFIKLGGRWTPIRPSYYPTPMDRRNAFRKGMLWAAWFATFAGLGVLLAWRC